MTTDKKRFNEVLDKMSEEERLELDSALAQILVDEIEREIKTNGSYTWKELCEREFDDDI